MPSVTTKQRIVDSVQELPEDATVEDAMERLYFLAKVQRGLAEVELGQFVSHDDIKRKFAK
jgi:predicted transcriptional regulator